MFCSLFAVPHYIYIPFDWPGRDTLSDRGDSTVGDMLGAK